MADDPPPRARRTDAPRGARPPRLSAALGLLALAVAIVALIGSTIGRGAVAALDPAILAAMRESGRPIGPPGLARAMVGITALGGGAVLMAVLAVAVLFLARRRWWTAAWLAIAATLSGRIAVDLAKQIVARPRPEVIDHLVHVSSASFPSGHAANGAIVYLTAAMLIARAVPGRARRGAILAAAAGLVIAIGFSRVYLGVHWPSDVLAGWGFGALWALGWQALGAWITRRRAAAAPP